MLIQSLMSGGLLQALVSLALLLPAVILCLTVHEVSHGVAAYAFGDRTAKNAGRLTFDPMAHIDPIGFLCLLLLGFGWARPVPVNVSNFKHRRLGMAVTAFAGPLSNFLLALIFFMIAIGLNMNGLVSGNTFLQALGMFVIYVGKLSVGLGVFNLIPIYPMDGSRILNAVLPFKAQVKLDRFVQNYQSVLVLLLVVVLWFGWLGAIISVATSATTQFASLLYSTMFL